MASWRLYFLVSQLICSLSAHAEGLSQIYELAVQRDPMLQQAYSVLQANKQALPQALAQMGPNLSATYQTTGTQAVPSTYNPGLQIGNILASAFNLPTPALPSLRYNTQNYGLTLNQPLYHPEHWSQLSQSRHIIKAAQASYLSATQSLIVKVAQQYFAVLAATDELDYAKGQRKAFAREYEQAKQRFEVGLIAITDVETAKARFDNAVATEIENENGVANQFEKLRETLGVPVSTLDLLPPSQKLILSPPTPNTQDAWVDSALSYNFDVIAAKENAKQAKAAIGTVVAGHYPKVDLQGNLNRNKSAPPYSDLTYTKSLSLNVNMPLFTSGGVYFKSKELRARHDEAQQKLEEQQRLAQSSTREAFRGVLTAISRVNALAQAIISSESALKATRAAYEVGTRTIVDVLNAETQLLMAERDHAKARYDYLLQGLVLKQKAGILKADDLHEISNLISQ